MELPDPVTSLTATSVPVGILFSVGLPAYFPGSSIVQLYEYTSSTPFASASLVAEFRGDAFTLPKSDDTTRYYWVTIKDKGTLQTSTPYPASTGVSGVRSTIGTGDLGANAASRVYDDYTSSATGITVSSGGQDVCSITVTESGVFEISVSGRMVRSAGTGGDSLIPTLDDSAGSGSFGGGSFVTWNTTATGESQTLSLTATYTTSGSGPWTIDLDFIHGGGLATFDVYEVGMRLTVVRR